MGHAAAISLLDLSASDAGFGAGARRGLSDHGGAALWDGSANVADWVNRYNTEGLTGLDDLKASGAAPKLTDTQKQELAIPVEQGPDLEVDGVVRWRRVDLRDKIESVFGVEMHERSVGNYLTSLGYRGLSVRPQHAKSDPEAQEAFKKSSMLR